MRMNFTLLTSVSLVAMAQSDPAIPPQCVSELWIVAEAFNALLQHTYKLNRVPKHADNRH
jgi:hypothetical protein